MHIIIVLFYFRGIQDEEARLKSLIEDSSQDNGEKKDLIWKNIRVRYTKLIIEYPTKNILLDIHGKLWKHCFYNQIEEYRKGIKKTTAAITAQDALSLQLQERARHHLIKLSSAFQTFLSEASLFYNDFLTQLENKLKVELAEDDASTQDTDVDDVDNIKNSVTDDVLSAVCKCLLYLGDLSRYSQLHSENREKNWTIAERYYSRAVWLMPSSGNPHNQVEIHYFNKKF